MPDTTMKVGIDFDDLIQPAQKAVLALSALNNEVENIGVKFIKLGERGAQVKAVFTVLKETGVQLTGTVEKLDGRWKAHIDTIGQNAAKIRELKNALEDQAAAAGVSAANSEKAAAAMQKMQAAQIQSMKFGMARTEMAQALPMPTVGQPSIASLVAYQSALQNVINTAQRLNVPVAQLQTMFAQLRTDPFRDVTAGSARLAQVQQAILRLKASHDQLTTSAQKGAEAAQTFGRSWAVSMQGLARLLQIQIAHRLLGELITAFQQAVPAAAEFEQQIAKIQTVVQGGIGFDQLRTQVADLANTFNRPISDVAQATYQGFSSQIMRSAGDMSFMNEALRLSRLTFSTASQATQILTETLHAYEMGAVDARRVTDLFVEAQTLGGPRLDQMHGAIGRVAAVGKQLGVSLEEVVGVITLMQQRGVPASQSMMQLTNIMNQMLRPSRELQQVFGQFGAATGRDFVVSAGGIVGVMQRLDQVAKTGNASIEDMIHSMRALRAAFALEGGGLADLQSIMRQLQAPTAAARIEPLITEPAGEKLKKSFNEIATYFTTDIGPRIIQGLQTAFAPLGGIEGAVKKITEALMTLAGAVGIVVTTFNVVVGIFDKMGVSINVLVQSTIIWLTLFKVAGPALAAASTAAMTGIFNLLTGTVSLTGAVTGLGNAIKWLFTTSSGWFVLITAGVALYNLFTQTKDAAGEAQAAVSAMTTQHKAEMEDLRKELAKTSQEFDTTLRQIRQAYATAFQPINQALSKAQELSKENLRRTSTDMAAGMRVISDGAASMLRSYQQAISAAESAIRESIKRTQTFRDKEGTEAFNLQMKQLQTGLMYQKGLQMAPNWFAEGYKIDEERRHLRAQDLVTEQQTALITSRIRDLTAEAARLQQQGDQVSMEGARRRYDEMRRLTEERFNLEQAMQRRNIMQYMSEQARMTGISQVRYMPDRTRELRRQLEEIQEIEAGGERNFQAIQRQTIQQQREMLEEERRRQVALTQSGERLRAFNVLNQQGQLRPEFKGTEGVTRALAQFDQLAATYRRAAQEAAQLRITDQELAAVAQRYGPEVARGIQESIRNRTLSATQQEQIESVMTNQRRNQFEQQVANHRQAEEDIRKVSQNIADQRLALETRLQVELARIRRDAMMQEINDRIAEIERFKKQTLEMRESAARMQQEGTRNLITQIEELGKSASSMDPSLFNQVRFIDSARLHQLVNQFNEMKEAAIQANNAFNLERTEENANRVRSSVQRLEEAYRRLVIATPAEDRPAQFRGLTEAQIRGMPLGTSGPMRDISGSIATLSTAQTRIASLDIQMRQMLGQAQTLPEELRGVNGQINNITTTMNTSNTNLSTALNGLITTIQNATERMGGRSVMPQQPPVPIINAPVNPQGTIIPQDVMQDLFGGPGGGFAEGGLIGGRFNSRGPDNQLASVRTGEMIINPESTRKFYSQLVAMNAGHYSEGGLVSNTSVGDISINVDGSKGPETTARAVLSLIRREMRRGNGGLS